MQKQPTPRDIFIKLMNATPASVGMVQREDAAVVLPDGFAPRRRGGAWLVVPTADVLDET